MKKMLSLILVVAMLMCSFIPAFAATGQSSSTGKEKFEQYLSTLKPERAAMIREDPELVYMMTQNAYWEKPTNIIPYASVSLPLSEYKAGTYFTYNGKACGCHSHCTFVVPDGEDTSRCYNTETETSGNCKRYNGGIQCKAFADYVFKKYSGVDATYYNSMDDDLIPSEFGNNSLGQTELSDFMRTLPVGANVRMINRNSTYGRNHSFIITGVSRTGVTIYDCNRVSYTCKVGLETRTWKQMVNDYKCVEYVWVP